MEGITMIMMAEMTEFVKEDIISQNLRQAHDIKVQIDIILC